MSFGINSIQYISMDGSLVTQKQQFFFHQLVQDISTNCVKNCGPKLSHNQMKNSSRSGKNHMPILNNHTLPSSTRCCPMGKAWVQCTKVLDPLRYCHVFSFVQFLYTCQHLNWSSAPVHWTQAVPLSYMSQNNLGRGKGAPAPLQTFVVGKTIKISVTLTKRSEKFVWAKDIY